MQNLIIKYTPINHIIDLSIFQHDWLISNIRNDYITLRNINLSNLPKKPKKKLSFSKNIDMVLFDKQNNCKSRSSAKMSDYGNPPDNKRKMFEHYLLYISNKVNLQLTREEFIHSLRVLKLYYYFMSHLIHCHYVLSNQSSYCLYSKRTLIHPSKLPNISFFINTFTDINQKAALIKKHIFKKYRFQQCDFNNVISTM